MMRPWIYVNNTFLTVTENSYRDCKKIGDYTLNVLNASAAEGAEPFVGLRDALQPFVGNFSQQYADWKGKIGTQKSQTITLTENLAALAADRIDDWEFLTQQSFRKGTPQFNDLFPNGRSPFQSGSQEDRITAVQTFNDKLANYPELETLKTLVNLFYNNLKTSFDTQKGTKGSTKTESAAVEAARKAVCVELFATLAALIIHYKNTPEEATAFFDLQTIRNREQTTFSHNIPGGETRLAVTHTFEEGEQVRLTNQGETPLKFALCTEANDPLGTPSVEVPANDELVVSVDQLGTLAQRFLKVQNLDETEGGRYSITLL